MHALLAHWRIALPLVAAVLCLLFAQVAGPVVAWILLIATFGFVLDAVTVAWPKGDNLTKYHQ